MKDLVCIWKANVFLLTLRAHVLLQMAVTILATGLFLTILATGGFSGEEGDKKERGATRQESLCQQERGRQR